MQKDRYFVDKENSMTRTTINAQNAPAAVGPYVHAVMTGDIVFTSGQLGLIPETGVLAEGVEAQAEQAIKNLAAVLEAIIWQQLVPTSDGKGRVAAFEVVHANHAVRSNIREGKSHLLMNTIQTSARDGMVTMDDALLDLYYKCQIDRETVLQFAQDTKSLESRMLSGLF